MEMLFKKAFNRLRIEQKFLFCYKDDYSRLKKEYEEILGQNCDYITLKDIEHHIDEYFHNKIPKLADIEEAWYPPRSQAEELLKFKTKYLDLYRRVKNIFLKYNFTIPDNAVMNEQNLDQDIVYNLIVYWQTLHFKKSLFFTWLKS